MLLKPHPIINISALVQWTDDERLQGEKDTLGLYLTGHPIDQYYDELKRHIACKSVIYSQHDAAKVSP
jgi:DNA polymerase III alpha subunit